MSHKFSKGIEEIKKIGLSSSEKSAMLSRIFENASAVTGSEPRFVKSFWLQNIFVGHQFRPALALALVFVLGGSGLIFGSNQALPGDALYSIKVNVAEPLLGSFRFSGEAKANWQITLATKRLAEAGALTKQGRLDESKQIKIEQLLAEHATALESDLKIMEAKDSQSDSFKSEDRVVKQTSEPAPTLMMMSAAQIETEPINKNSKTEAIKLDFESKMNSGANFLESISNEKSGTTSNEVFNISQKARESGNKINKDWGDRNNEKDEINDKEADDTRNESIRIF
ncbi:MAG TPA: DUF5667 domain-containing protein [Candidatus Paceibacterota bacterium]